MVSKTKVLALYLPQYYETDYNSDWWGKGYTEWTACKQAKPLYNGHYQPKLPLNDNFYDLSIKQNIEYQVNLAKEYGIDGFVIYQYYSANGSNYGKKNGKNGSMLLSIPTEILRDNRDLNVAYCLYWANHDWRKLWFGQDPQMLWEQKYGNEDDWKEYFEYNLTYFNDERYIKVNNKPVFIIFAPWHFKNVDKFIAYWNELARQNGFDGIFFIKTADAHTSDSLDGFDALFKREPFYTFAKGFGTLEFIKRVFRTRLTLYANKFLKYFNTGLIGYKCDYDKLWDSILNNFENNPRVIPGAVADWDNTARKGYNCQVLTGFNPNVFGEKIGSLFKKCNENSIPFLIINAWNEWAEGAYLEPDRKYEYKILEKIKYLKIN